MCCYKDIHIQKVFDVITGFIVLTGSGWPARLKITFLTLYSAADF